MAQYHEDPCLTFTSATALAEFLRVTVSSAGVATLAGATAKAAGTVEQAAYAASKPVTVRMMNAPGTRKMVASGAITAGSEVYAAASGKVASSGTVFEGVALSAATADNDVIEVIQLPRNVMPVIICTAATTLTRAQSGGLITNLGAAGSIEITLPQDAKKDDYFDVVVLTAQQLQLSPGAAGALYHAGSKRADDKHAWADAIGECMRVVCVGDNDWASYNVVGTWTVET